MDDQLRQKATQVSGIISGYLRDNKGWTVVKNSKGIKVERKQSSCVSFTNGHLYRGQMEYQCSKEIVFKYISPFIENGLYRKKWDKDLREFECLRKIDENLWVLHTLTNSAALGAISARDFIDICLNTRTEECLSTVVASIDYPDCPPLHKYIRGWNYPSGSLIMSVPGNPNNCKLVLFFQPDIKGRIPKSLLDSACPITVAGVLKHLHAQLKKDGHIPK